MPDSVLVQAPARAHLGLLQTAAAFGRRNMGLGFAVSNPSWCLRVMPSRHDAIAGDVSDELRESGLRMLTRLRTERPSTPIQVEVLESVPTHAGLGSKTAFLCSLLAAARAVMHDSHWTDLRALTGRGGTSGIGINTIVRGGVILDVGHAVPDGDYRFVPSSRSAAPIPDVGARWPALPWPIAIVVPLHARRFSGADEASLFERSLPLPRTESEAVAALTLFRLIPAVATRDYAAFTAAVAELQERGFKRHEWSAQDAVVHAIRNRLVALGADCVALSSVGPAMIVLSRDLNALIAEVESWSAGAVRVYRSLPADRGLTVTHEH
jgi:beta-ribofuranosylaminobenzene 5'-phosphate synthase